MLQSDSFAIVVLLSGNGSNLQAILDAIEAGQLNCTVKAVISNNPEAFGLTRAQQSGIPTKAIKPADYTSRERFDDALMQIISEYQPDLVVLAGYMRILSTHFVDQLAGKLINIHPSLLPKYKGLHTHRRALENHDTEHGVSIHFVTPELDGGPVICQAVIPVLTDDTEESLQHRIHTQEHIIYPKTIQWFAEGRISLQDNHVLLDDIPLDKHGYRFFAQEDEEI